MARKSGPTILQEELYPSSAEAAREEMDDSRLVDLDVDEESPFLRGQKRISARRSSLPKKTASRLLWSVVAAAGLCVAAVGAAVLYRYGEHSWRFRVESSDNIEVAGMQNVSKAQIMEVMGADIGRNIFFIPLAQQKAQLEQIPWVESASVMRFVPNRLKVEIHERTPVAFARMGPRMFLIDAGGTLMELSPKHKYSFPVILGMNPGEPLSTRAPRMKTYAEMVRELDSGGARYSQDLSEVDLSDLEDLKVRVNDAAGDVLVHLGSSDYLRRFKIYVSHAQGWRQQFQKLESVNLRYDNQVIVNPDMERTAKRAALSPAVAKAAAAAGVKPAALITRLPHDRAVPKPAFELTEKKLDPKAAASGTKKAAARSKVRKTAAKGKTTAVAKKAAATGKQPPAHSTKPTAKSPAGGGQKPSPAVAKSETSQGPTK
ncbi:MAG TPA: FtsQ-type POTRA domain-containing protein [Candidatus Acidoferrum sp.]|jgi:cell division protein FtsQ|nr:FtsQ-type POTRA domain-containing protein [Candidatus Acidoferrum sp.]